MTIAANLGFPRIGPRRELKTALEAFWNGADGLDALLHAGAELRARHWALQRRLGIQHVPANDFSFYDHVLDTACVVGALPPGYGWSGGAVAPAVMFALARGAERPALEMTKWFDTNYHYLVPVLARGQHFELTENRPLAAFLEAIGQNCRTRPVLLGPVSFLSLCKTEHGGDPLALLDGLLPVYARVLAELAEAGVAWVQMDEPALALDLPETTRRAFAGAYDTLARGPAPRLLLTSYFAPLGDNLAWALRLPVAGLHLDLVRGASDLAPALRDAPAELALSLGVIDGRNVWRTDLRAALAVLRRAAEAAPGRMLMVAPSCSLLHVPVDLAQETALPAQPKQWLAFAVQKLEEVAVLARALDEGEAAVSDALAASDAAIAAHRASSHVHDAAVAARLAAVAPDAERRAAPFAERRAAQRARLDLPLFPATTIGSFPQTEAVRHLRAQHARGAIGAAQHDQAIAAWIEDAVRWQEEIGLDMLVHGEFERNDMVKYFGEQLQGFAFTRHGWVQSYGSRCVAPPIIWGDVSRPAPMTLRWTAHAQALTRRPVKAMLTGPVTMLQWSFARDDIPRETICRQLALALRDEVADLEQAGIAVIQVDEPALREGLPLRAAARADYLRWAIGCFRLATGVAGAATQVHTHMCYADFSDILDGIAAMDADVISIEATRSRMELLGAFAGRSYPNEIGPGVWDIHSPRVPSTAEMLALLRAARRHLADWQIWVNPDCGLKTRRWEEVRPALANMVEAARSLRAEASAEVVA